MSSTWEPPLNCPFVKSAGRIGNFRSSLSWSADGPSPRPVSPWHSQHLALTYSSLPRARSSGVAGGGGGSTTGGSGFSSFHRGERVLMYVMTANRSLSGISCIKTRSEEHTSELQSHHDLVCRLLLEKKK